MTFPRLLRTVAIAITLPFTLASQVAASPLWISTYEQGGYVHLRQEPSTRSRIAGRLTNATQVESLQRRLAGDHYWYQVDTGQETGWVRGDFVMPVGPVSPRATMTCEAAIAQVDARLNGVPKAAVTGSMTQAHFYEDGPINRDQVHTFSISGPAEEDVMNSMVMQSQMAAQVIENCPQVGLVRFVVHQTDWALDYGLMYDGMIQAFRCDEDWGEVTAPVWGERVCL